MWTNGTIEKGNKFLGQFARQDRLKFWLVVILKLGIEDRLGFLENVLELQELPLLVQKVPLK